MSGSFDESSAAAGIANPKPCLLGAGLKFLVTFIVLRRTTDEGAVTMKLWIYVMVGGAIAAYIASIAAKSMFAPLS